MAIAEWVLTGGLLAGIGYTCVRSLASGGRRGRLRLLALRRAPRARRAAAEAALDDPAFSPERIEAAVQDMLPEVLGDDAQLAVRPRVDILGVVNRERESEDRVVVRVRARLQSGAIDQRWTLVHRGTQWRLAAAAGDPLAEPLLTAPLITSPADDDERLHEASLQELTAPARRGRPPAAELVDPDTPPPQQLADLSVADDRFEPMLIEAALNRIVEAWEHSTDASDAPLLAVATGAGADAVQFPAHEPGRRGIRDARLERWEVTRVEAGATPPSVEVRVDLRATLAGDLRSRRLRLAWTLVLVEADGRPRWRLTHSADTT